MTDAELRELKARADADNPDAMFEYARHVHATSQAAYEKYVRLAAQLGQPEACELLGDKYMEADECEKALHFYRVGAKSGRPDCAVKVAIIRLSIDEPTAIRELEELAESGIKSACSALAEYYKALGNRKQANFWRSIAN